MSWPQGFRLEIQAILQAESWNELPASEKSTHIQVADFRSTDTLNNFFHYRKQEAYCCWLENCRLLG